jgi:flagellar hook-associated protein 3 FlgL
MRISFAHQYDVYRSDLGRSQEAYFEAQRKVSTGKRIHSVSDDPFSATASISFRQVRNAAAQYAKNAETAKSFLGFTENALGEMSKLMQRVNELAVAGANGATDQVGRQAMAQELGEIQRRMVDLANGKGPVDQYLFSGQKSDTKPFSVAGSVVTYSGDANNLYVEVSPNETLNIGAQLGTFVPDLYSKLEALKNNLQGGNTGAISGVDLANVQTAKRDIDQMRGEVGTRTQTADQAITNHTRRMDDLTSRISDLEDVDISEAILEYKTAETAYQAAMQTISMGSQLSLMDFLR